MTGAWRPLHRYLRPRHGSSVLPSSETTLTHAGDVVTHVRRTSPQSRFVILILLLLAIASPYHVLAHGGGTPQLAAAPVGAYRVYAWTSPEPWRAGQVHTTVAVTLATSDSSEVPVSGAQVTVHYAPTSQPDAAIVAPAAEGVGTKVGFYEADADLPTTGEWQVTIQVAGPDGSGETAFTVQVLPADEFNWWLAGGGLLLALVAIGFLGTRRRAGRQHQPQAPKSARS